MNPLCLNRARISRSVWETILDHAEQHNQLKDFLKQQLAQQDELRIDADYNTGSIPSSAAWLNFAIAKYFDPNVVAEVVTFIGKSTISLAYGMHWARKGEQVRTQKEIHTCDMSNNIILPSMPWSVLIEQYPKQSSVQMFQTMDEKNIHADIINIDGRLSVEDFDMLPKVIKEDTIILVDDFEGVEKGVANVFNLMMQPCMKGHSLVYPPERELLLNYGFTEQCFTAMLVPLKIVQFTNQ
jgi:predicted O-methyltransferase YrrM